MPDTTVPLLLAGGEQSSGNDVGADRNSRGNESGSIADRYQSIAASVVVKAAEKVFRGGAIRGW